MVLPYRCVARKHAHFWTMERGEGFPGPLVKTSRLNLESNGLVVRGRCRPLESKFYHDGRELSRQADRNASRNT